MQQMLSMTKTMQQIRDHYDIHAEQWMQQKDNPFYHVQQFWRFTDYIPPTARVLDIGCAGGIHAKLFQLWPSIQHDGIDLSRHMIEIAKKSYPRQQFWNCDLMNFVPVSGLYDAFWAAAVLMHFTPDEVPAALAKIQAVTKPSAMGYITLPESRPNPETADERHFSYYTEMEAIALFRNAGWKIIEFGRIEYRGNPSVWHWYIVKMPA